MRLGDFLSEERVELHADIAGRREAIQALARLIAGASGLEPAAVADTLGAREKLGSTAIGKGVAIPHARHAGLAEPVAALITLANPIAFDAPDDELVDVIIGVLAPSDGELTLLAQLVRRLREEDLLETLRNATSVAQALAAMRQVD